MQEQLGLSDGLALHQGQLHRRGHGEIGFQNQILDPISNEDDSCTVFFKVQTQFCLIRKQLFVLIGATSDIHAFIEDNQLTYIMY